jgi:hypothetical protein
MENKDLFFEIKGLAVSEGFKANVVMAENNGTGAAYLGWCEGLAIDAQVRPDPDGKASVLLLPYADLALLIRQGTPIKAPDEWQSLVIRPLVIQEYLLLTLEVELKPEAEISFQPVAASE